MTYLISVILLILIFITKVFFVFIGKGQPTSPLDFVSLAILMGIMFMGTVDYIKNGRFSKSDLKFKPIDKFLVVACLAVIAFSFFISVTKKTVLWDAVALYDARSIFLAQGTNFSQMVELSKFDPQNSYYYVLYPPFTSVIHYFWYQLGIPLNLAVIYSFLFLLLAIVTFIFAYKRIGITLALLLTVFVVTNGAIFSSSVAEYTNLPFTLQMFLGIVLLHQFFEDNQKWKFLFGSGLVITTMWVRFLEPLWVGVVITFFITSFIKKCWSSQLIYPLVFGAYGVIEYAGWQSFVNSFGSATKIVSFGLVKIIEPLVGIFTGSALAIMIFFIKSWGPILIVYLFAICLAFINRKKMDFLQIFLVITILIYYSGLYFVSFQSVWWNTLGGSLVRGSTFMLPISAYLILEYLYDKKN